MLVVLKDGDKTIYMDTKNGEVERPINNKWEIIQTVGTLSIYKVLVPHFYLEMMLTETVFLRAGWNPKGGFETYKDAFAQMEYDILNRTSSLDNTVYRISQIWE